MKSKSTPQLDHQEKTPWKGEASSASCGYSWSEEPFSTRLRAVSVGVNVHQATRRWDRYELQAQGQRAASELDLKKRYIFESIRLRELERGGLGPRSAASAQSEESLNLYLIQIYRSLPQPITTSRRLRVLIFVPQSSSI